MHQNLPDTRLCEVREAFKRTSFRLGFRAYIRAYIVAFPTSTALRGASRGACGGLPRRFASPQTPHR